MCVDGRYTYHSLQLYIDYKKCLTIHFKDTHITHKPLCNITNNTKGWTTKQTKHFKKKKRTKKERDRVNCNKDKQVFQVEDYYITSHTFASVS